MSATGRWAFLFRNEASHYHVLTGLRGYAAFWVFLYHVWVLSGFPKFHWTMADITLDFTPLVALGGAGVTVFFVLSGFLLALPFAEWQTGLRERPALGRYLRHRLARVFPAYYVQLALLLLVAAIASGPAAIPDGGALLRHLAMLFMPPPLGTTPINGVWWTLPIEFSFYLLLPFLAFLLRPGRWWLLLAGSMLAMWLWRHTVIIRLGDAPLSLRVLSSYQLAGSFDMFGLGMLAAVIHVNRNHLPSRLLRFMKHGLLTLAGLALLVVAVYWLFVERRHYWADFPIYYLWTPTLSLGTIALIISGLGGSRLAEILFANRPMVFTGVVSYSYYLWHQPVLQWIVGSHWYQTLPGNRFAWLLAVSTPTIFLVATLSYVLVERPFMNMRKASREA